ncbi:MAG: PAS domain S-box protein [Myxococcales bacterium]|nr:PAS domain S-box protein [Myxococcales bacterium]
MAERFDLGAALPALKRALDAAGVRVVSADGGPPALELDEEAGRSRAESQFEALVEAIPEPVFIVGLGGLSYGNPAAVRLFGYDRLDEALGQDPRTVAHPEDVPELEQRAAAMLLQRRTLPPFEYRVYRRDGALLTIEVSSIPVDYQGVPSILTFARDVTERKRSEAALLQADRLAVLGFLAGGLAHAMNNPLSYVLLNLDEIERAIGRGIAADAERERVLQRLREAYQGAQRIADVVRRMRALSRVDDDKRSPVDVRSVLESAIELMGNELRHRGELVVELGDAPPVQASRSRLEQVFLNLIAHATQSLPETGEGRVELMMRGEGEQVVVDVYEHADVADQGELSRMLEPFPTPREGMRRLLSLPLCRSIVEGLGGKMTVDDENSGLHVRIVLPAMGARTSPDVLFRPAFELGTLVRVPVRLLVVDTDVAVGSALRLVLPADNSISCVRDPREASEALIAGDRYDLVLCDSRLPDAGAKLLVDELEANAPGLLKRVALMLGEPATDADRELLARIRDQCIDKRFDRDEVRTLVASARRAAEAH